MKKNKGMMFPNKKNKVSNRLRCSKCGKELTPKTAYYYVDGCNCAITDNALPLCLECCENKVTIIPLEHKSLCK